MIPEFKNTNEAITYGRTNKGNEFIIEMLRVERLKLHAKALLLMNEEKEQEAVNLYCQAQFVREAREVADGTYE